MAFVRFRGKTKLMHFKKADTTHALSDGSLVKLDDSSNVIPCTNDTTDRPIGVCRQTVALTDTSNALVPVEVPVENAVEWLIDTDTDGGALDSDVGRYCAVDTAQASDSNSTRVDISDTTIRQVLITGIVSATKVRGVIARSAWNRSISGDTA